MRSKVSLVLWRGDDPLPLLVVLLKIRENNLHIYSRLDTDTRSETDSAASDGCEDINDSTGGVILSSIDRGQSPAPEERI